MGGISSDQSESTGSATGRAPMLRQFQLWGTSQTGPKSRAKIRLRAAAALALTASLVGIPAFAGDHYTNAYGRTVHSPVPARDGQAPRGATARCRDGDYSFSQHRRGTCSHHGGVAVWLRHS